MLGLTVSAGVVNIFVFAVFLKPVSEALGIGRGVLATGILFSSGVGACMSPFAGHFVDRFGACRVMLIGIPLYAVSLLGLSMLRAHPLFFIYLLFALCGVFGSSFGPISYSSLISARFDRQRGLALGIAIAGVGLGVALVPPLAELYIRVFGWRAAYICVAATVVGAAWLPCAPFADEGKAQAAQAQRPAKPSGLTLVEALGDWRFWAMGASCMLAAAGINGLLVHFVALLGDRGVVPQTAVAAMSLVGVAMIGGRIAAGWLTDRWHGSLVTIIFYGAAIAGVGLLAMERNAAEAYAAGMFLGLGIGALPGQQAFLVTRFFGLRAYGKLFGIQFGLLLFGQGAGAAVVGALFDRGHSYQPAFVAAGIALAGACISLMALGAYRYAPQANSATAPKANARASSAVLEH
jgi:predicted MFS family arabinose efflux permease